MKGLLILLVFFILGCGSSRKVAVESLSDTQVESSEGYPFGRQYEYKYKLLKPVTRDELFISDKNIGIEFVIDRAFIHLRLKNKTTQIIGVRIEEAQIFTGLRSSPAISFNYFNDFQYSPVNSAPERIAIVPNAYIVLHLVPQDNILEIDGEYEVADIYPTVDWNDEERVRQIYSNINKKLGLYLPIEIGDKIYDYYFEFQIVDVREVGPYHPRRRVPPAPGQLSSTPATIVVETKSENIGPEESFIASTLIAFFVLISAYFLFAKEKAKI
jgi:hypothetical protein